MGPRIREDNGRGRAVPEPFPNRPYVGVAEPDTGMGVGGVGKMDVGGRNNHKGCPYEDGDGCRRRGKDGSPHPRGQREGEGGSRTAPTWESPNTT